MPRLRFCHRHSRAGAACLIVLFACMAGCAEVQPWQRGALAKPQMAIDPHPLHGALRRHIQDSREAAAGGNAGQGGGCGCN